MTDGFSLSQDCNCLMEMCLVFIQRVLVQAVGSAQKGGQVQQISVPRVQQVPQQVHNTVFNINMHF